jgi:hypothetical protein
VHLTAEGLIPEGWTVSIWLDDEQVATSGTLPAEIALDLSTLNGPKHRIWIGVLDEAGEPVGRAERVFRLGATGVLG